MYRWAMRRLHPVHRRPRPAGSRSSSAIVYFAQGMWYLPNQTITIVFKDARPHRRPARRLLRGSARSPWLIKPVYGLLSDFVPLFGRRRRSYFLLTSALAAAGRRSRSSLMPRRVAYWPLLAAVHG